MTSRQIKALSGALLVATMLSQLSIGFARPPVSRSVSERSPKPRAKHCWWLVVSRGEHLVAVAPLTRSVSEGDAGALTRSVREGDAGALTRSVREGERSTMLPIASVEERSPSLTLRVSGGTNQEPDAAKPESTDEKPKSSVGDLLNQPRTPSTSTVAPAPQANQPLPSNVDVPVTQTSSLLSQLSRGQERAAQSAAPAATGIDVNAQSSAVDTTQLVRQSSSATSISGVRRSPVSIQPVLRGYSQSQIYSQYQGANFVPARIDFDSILSSIDPGVIDNLIIIPGPYGVKYGPGISFIDIVATPTPRYDSTQVHSRTNTMAQSNGGQLYGRETVFGGAKDYGFRFSAGQKVGSDYRSGNGTSIPSSYNVADVDFAGGFDLTEFTKLEIEYLQQVTKKTEFAGLVYDADFRKTDALFARLNYNEPGEVRWLAESWFNRTDFQGNNLGNGKQRFYRDDLFFTSPTPFPEKVTFTGFTAARTDNAGFRIAPTFGEPDDGELTLGFDFHYIAQRLDEFDLFEEKTLQVSPSGYDNFPVPPARSLDPGLYFEWKQPLDESLTVTTGGRIDYVVSRADGTHRARAPDGGIPAIVDLNGVTHDSYEDILGEFSQENILLAGFVSADYKLTDELKLRAGFGHGERAPNATERYAHLPFFTVVQLPSNPVFGNPSLKPEKANQFDLSLNGNFDDVRFQVSGFFSYVADFITLRDFEYPGSGSRNLRYTNTNASLFGTEAAGEVDWTESWSTFFNLSFVEGRDLDLNAPLESIYPLQSRVGLSWHSVDRKKYGIDFAARIVRHQSHVASYLRDAEPTTPGFTTFDLRGHWQATDHLRLNAGIENLTDKNYLEHLNVHNPSVLEPGINFFLGAQWDY